MKLLPVFAALFALVSILGGSRAIARPCGARTIQNTAYINQLNEVTVAILEMEAEESCTLDELARILDPQNWSRCNPANFSESYLVDPAQPETKLVSPPAPGSPWEGVLHENLNSAWRIPLLGRSVGYFTTQNLISFKIRKMETPDAQGEYYHADWKLRKAMPSVLFGSHYRSALNLDEGFMTLKKTPEGRWKILGWKYARFELLSSRSGAKKEVLSALVNQSAPGMVSRLFETTVASGFNCGMSR